jgi:hypothetical protein
VLAQSRRLTYMGVIGGWLGVPDGVGGGSVCWPLFSFLIQS